MNTKFLTIAILFFLSLSFTNAQVVVKAKPRKAKILVLKTKRPSTNHIWIDGQWKWNKKSNRYVWVNGKWSKPKHGYVWVAGSWKNLSNGFVWKEGYWRRRVA